jgi:cellulose synthase/poly-beta-1,6-N-acetylglucosamine synthase-like glycosyltransferase
MDTSSKTTKETTKPFNIKDHNKYAYIVKRPGLVRLMYGLAVLSWLLVLYGLTGFLRLHQLHLLFIPIVAIVGYYRLVSYTVMSQYPGFDIKKHNRKIKKYWDKYFSAQPSVDIFLPIFGEDLSVIRETWEGVKHINYTNFKVHVLDDGDSSDAKTMAQEFGFNYMVREDRGKYKKAGNLRNGYDNTDGEFVLILDADFIPHPDILSETIPYFEDSKIGIVQTPQYFRKSSEEKPNPIQFGAEHVVEEFYKILQVSRDKFGAAGCVGTSALYRRTAIVEGGGPPRVERSEDAWERLLVKIVGYDLKYLPLILAVGLTPETPEQYFKQHNRWSTGSVELVTSQEFWRTPFNFVQRILFVQNSLYYLAETLSLILTLQLYVLLIFHPETINWIYALFFIPHIIMYYFVIPATKSKWNWWKSSITATTQIYTYLQSYIILLSCKLMEWLPTGRKNSFLNKFYIRSVFLNGAYLLTLLTLLAVGLALNYDVLLVNISMVIVLFWISLNIFQHSMNFIFNLNFIFGTKQEQLDKELISLDSYRLWRWRLGTFTTVVALMFIGLISAIAVTGNTLQNSANPISGEVAGVSEIVEPLESTDVLATANDDSIEIPTSPTPMVPTEETTPTVFQISVQRGDSLARVIRRSILAYEEETNMTYSNAQRIYVETKLLEDKGFATVDVGDELVINKESIQIYFDESKSLSEYQLQLWSSIAQRVSYI